MYSWALEKGVPYLGHDGKMASEPTVVSSLVGHRVRKVKIVFRLGLDLVS